MYQKAMPASEMKQTPGQILYPDETNAFSKVAVHAVMWEIKAQLETYCNDIKRKGILGKTNWEARERESRLQKFYFSLKVYLLKIAATPNHAYIQPPPQS